MTKNNTRLLILSIISLSLFLLLTLGVIHNRFAGPDEEVLRIIYSMRSQAFTNVMYFVTFFGGEFILVSSILISVLLYLKKHIEEAVYFSFIVYSGFILNTFLKFILHIPRPDIDPLFSIGFYAYPSAHAMDSVIFYGLISYLFYHFVKDKILSLLVIIASVITVVLIGFSRLYLGVHFPSDIIGGFLAGFWWLSFVIFLEKRLVSKKFFEKKK